MPIQQLDLYDIIVDVIPGIVLGVLILPLLLPYDIGDSGISVPTGAAMVVVLTTLGYVLGRIIHGVSSTKIFQAIRNVSIEFLFLPFTIATLLLIDNTWMNINESVFLFALILWAYLIILFSGYRYMKSKRPNVGEGNGSKGNISIYKYLNQIFPIGSNLFGDVRHFETRIEEGMYGRNLGDVEKGIYRKFVDEFESEFEISLVKAETDGLKFVADPEQVKYLSHSILYNKPTLYRKYEILNSFFRSLWFAFFILSFGYLIELFPLFVSVPFSSITIWSETADQFEIFAAITILTFVILSIIFQIQQIKFENRKQRALINDIILDMTV